MPHDAQAISFLGVKVSRQNEEAQSEKRKMPFLCDREITKMTYLRGDQSPSLQTEC